MRIPPCWWRGLGVRAVFAAKYLKVRGGTRLTAAVRAQPRHLAAGAAVLMRQRTVRRMRLVKRSDQGVLCGEVRIIAGVSRGYGHGQGGCGPAGWRGPAGGAGSRWPGRWGR